VECAAGDWPTRGILSGIDDLTARQCADAEREVLWVLNGHCNSPIAGLATIDGMQMSLTASVLDEDGRRFIEVSRSGPADRPRELGRAVGLELLAKGASDIIERSRPGVTERR
jgi:hydroxymethylbilane synthase